MLKKIVVGIDGSKNADFAFQSALNISKKVKSELVCVFVVDSGKTTMPFMYSAGGMGLSYEQVVLPIDRGLTEAFEKIAADMLNFVEKRLDVYRKKAKEAGVSCSSIIREGDPAELLSEEARAGGLLVIGKHGENSGKKRVTVGSCCEELLHTSPRPILVCPEKPAAFSSMLFPYDSSRSAENAMQFLANTIKNLSEKVTMVLIDEQSCEENEIKEEVSYLQSHEIKATLINESGSPGKVLSGLIDKKEFDFILMGSRGRRKLIDAVIGSTTLHLVRKSDLPIMIVY